MNAPTTPATLQPAKALDDEFTIEKAQVELWDSLVLLKALRALVFECSEGTMDRADAAIKCTAAEDLTRLIGMVTTKVEGIACGLDELPGGMFHHAVEVKGGAQ